MGSVLRLIRSEGITIEEEQTFFGLACSLDCAVGNFARASLRFSMRPPRWHRGVAPTRSTGRREAIWHPVWLSLEAVFVRGEWRLDVLYSDSVGLGAITIRSVLKNYTDSANSLIPNSS